MLLVMATTDSYMGLAFVQGNLKSLEIYVITCQPRGVCLCSSCNNDNEDNNPFKTYKLAHLDDYVLPLLLISHTIITRYIYSLVE